MNELDIIKVISKKLPGVNAGVVLGVGDDAAIVKGPKGKYTLLASDMLVSGVHFVPSEDPFRIGWKAAAVNLSDIAAMGGRPLYMLMSLAGPLSRKKYMLSIVEGARKIASRWGVEIVGGDTNFSKDVVVDVSIVGEVDKSGVCRRDGAKQGDMIFVTGDLGNGPYRHLDFTPRVDEARTLVNNFGINSMIDISDGLFIDLWRVCSRSGIGAVIHESMVPLRQGALKKDDDPKKIMNYGEDFELLFTASRSEGIRIMKALGNKIKFPVSLIGYAVKSGMTFVRENGKKERMRPQGYVHGKRKK